MANTDLSNPNPNSEAPSINQLKEIQRRLEKENAQRQKLLEQMEQRAQASDGVMSALLESKDQMEKEIGFLRNKLGELEVKNSSSAGDGGVTAGAGGGLTRSLFIGTPNSNEIGNGERNKADADSDEAVVPNAWAEENSIKSDEAAAPPSQPPPMRSVKFVDRTHINSSTTPVLRHEMNDESSTDSSSTSSEEAIAFSGWARVFFQARHHRAATQIICSATTTTSQDTYLYLSINTSANELRISNTEDRRKPPIIDPPIPLRFFYAVKVPGSHSGAALFLKNDNRRLRKYIFRFEFVNRAVHQPPQRYIQFVRSGNAAKKSMRQMGAKFLNMGETVATKIGKEERKENQRENTKKAQDAFAAHLSTLDELLRESSESADRFVECVNSKAEEEEEILMARGGLGGEGRAVKRTKPPPPYWGSGFNRPNTNEEEDDEVETDSDFSEEEEELYEDENDDETFFDKVQVTTEQTLESLFHHIVK